MQSAKLWGEMVKELSDGVTETPNIAKTLKEIVTGENYLR